MKIKKSNDGFTLIELIMVMIILGVLSAVAIPRYLETIEKAEEASEDAVISNISVALENYGVHKLIDSGRAIWPDNPFDALKDKPQTYTYLYPDTNPVTYLFQNPTCYLPGSFKTLSGEFQNGLGSGLRRPAKV